MDPGDDGVFRWVVWHYRYDADRNERRNVVVAAFDDPEEFHAEVGRRVAELRSRRELGEPVDPAERISGTSLEAGHRRRQDNAHLLRRAVEHGATPTNIDELELPPTAGIIRAKRAGAQT